mgnify:CR=1 FL=1
MKKTLTVNLGGTVYHIDEDAYIMQFVPYNHSDCFKTRTIRLDDEDTMSRLICHKVVDI